MSSSTTGTGATLAGVVGAGGEVEMRVLAGAGSSVAAFEPRSRAWLKCLNLGWGNTKQKAL